MCACAIIASCRDFVLRVACAENNNARTEQNDVRARNAAGYARDAIECAILGTLMIVLGAQSNVDAEPSTQNHASAMPSDWCTNFCAAFVKCARPLMHVEHVE